MMNTKSKSGLFGQNPSGGLCATVTTWETKRVRTGVGGRSLARFATRAVALETRREERWDDDEEGCEFALVTFNSAQPAHCFGSLAGGGAGLRLRRGTPERDDG